MSAAYVDTSALVSVAFDDPSADEARARLARHSRLVSSNLLEAELRAVFALYLAPKPAEIAFVTFDRRQRMVASALGFQVGTER